MTKNYLKLLFILIGTILLTIIVFNLYHSYENNHINNSYLSKYVTSINYNELSNALTELNNESFIYLTYKGDKKIYDLEKQIRKELKDNELEKSFIYVDCTKYLNNDLSVKNINNLFLTNEKIILPAIIYFKDNNPKDYIDSKDNLLNINSFKELIEKYEVGEH